MSHSASDFMGEVCDALRITDEDVDAIAQEDGREDDTGTSDWTAAALQEIGELQTFAESILRDLGIEPDDYQDDIDGARVKALEAIAALRGENKPC